MQEYENMHNYGHRQLHLPITFPYVVGRARPKAGEQFCGRARPKAGEQFCGRARPKAGENAAKPQQKSGGGVGAARGTYEFPNVFLQF